MTDSKIKILDYHKSANINSRNNKKNGKKILESHTLIQALLDPQR